MPIGLKRHYGRDDLHFLTFSCYRRLPLLGTTRARNIFVRALGKIRRRYGFRLVGYVVMPNHVHLLISESEKASPSMVLKALKQVVSRDLRKKRRRTSERQLSLAFSKWGRRIATLLAAEVLRLQCIHSKEEEGKTGVHARESGEPGTGQESGGVDLEQLFVPFEW